MRKDKNLGQGSLPRSGNPDVWNFEETSAECNVKKVLHRILERRMTVILISWKSQRYLFLTVMEWLKLFHQAAGLRKTFKAFSCVVFRVKVCKVIWWLLRQKKRNLDCLTKFFPRKVFLLIYKVFYL